MALRARCIRHAGRKGLPGTLRPFHTLGARASMAGPPPTRLPQQRLPPHIVQISKAEAAAEKERRKQQAMRREKRRAENWTGKIGSVLEDRWVPDLLYSDPPKPSDVTLELLMANQTHMGHATSLWNPENSRYIMGVREGIHIISLEVTAAHLLRAARVVDEVAYRGGIILFVGTRKGHSRVVSAASDMASACRLWTRWTPGLITNREVLLKSNLVRVVDEHDQAIPGFEKYSEVPRPLIPDLVVCLNPLENGPLLHECALANIPTIGVIDTDADPTKVTYTIPANDDSLRSVAVISLVLGRAGQAGNRRRLRDAKEDIVAWKTNSFLNVVADQIHKRIAKALMAAGLEPDPYKGLNEEVNPEKEGPEGQEGQEEAPSLDKAAELRTELRAEAALHGNTDKSAKASAADHATTLDHIGKGLLDETPSNEDEAQAPTSESAQKPAKIEETLVVTEEGKTSEEDAAEAAAIEPSAAEVPSTVQPQILRGEAAATQVGQQPELAKNPSETVLSKEGTEVLKTEEVVIDKQVAAGKSQAPEALDEPDAANKQMERRVQQAIANPVSQEPVALGPKDVSKSTLAEQAIGTAQPLPEQAVVNEHKLAPQSVTRPTGSMKEAPEKRKALEPELEPAIPMASTKPGAVAAEVDAVNITQNESVGVVQAPAEPKLTPANVETEKATPTERVQGTEDLIMMEAQLAEKLATVATAKPSPEEQKAKAPEAGAPEEGTGDKKD